MVSEQSKCEVPINVRLRHAGKSETASERAKISALVICFPPFFLFSKREAPTTVNSQGPAEESDRSRYFGTCLRWETKGKIDVCHQNIPTEQPTWRSVEMNGCRYGPTPDKGEGVERSVGTYLPAPLSSGRGSRCGPPQRPGVNWEHWSYWSSGSSACPLSLALVPAGGQTDGLSNRTKGR